MADGRAARRGYGIAWKAKSILPALLLLLTVAPFATPNQPGIVQANEVKILGSEQVVFSWKTNRCELTDIPDLPARAFRDADGKVQLIASHYVTRRMIGATLDSVQRDCGVVMDSHKETDPAKFNDYEWLASTYTPDGKTIYALIHNEYQGDKASRWQADRDFSSTQGERGWRYREWTGSRYIDMTFDSQHDRWQGDQQLCLIGPDWEHPDQACEPAREWVSPITATVTLSGNVKDLDPGGGDGVAVSIMKNSEKLWGTIIENGDTQGSRFNIDVPVQTGDAIILVVNARSNPNFDTTYFNAKINIGGDPCPSGQYESCWYNAVTFAKSTDKGLTYIHAPAPEHLVASVPYRYQADTGPWGLFEPSNMIRNPRDGYYYALLNSEDHLLQRKGTCAMRTSNLDDPRSWGAWDGTGFNVRFINPYIETGADPAQHVCQVVSFDEIERMHESLTFSTAFNKFLLVGAAGLEDSTHRRIVHGFYYSLSDDLIHWSPRKLLMEARPWWVTDLPGEALAYPSLLDPNDTSRNFEITGRQPYLYYTRFHSGLDRDLVRVRIEFPSTIAESTVVGSTTHAGPSVASATQTQTVSGLPLPLVQNAWFVLVAALAVIVVGVTLKIRGRRARPAGADRLEQTNPR